jgi:hypothetical protein
VSLPRPQGGPVARDGGERGGSCGVVRAEKGGVGKAGGNGGGTLLKGRGGKVAEGGPGGEGTTQRREGVEPGPGRWVAPRPTAARPQRMWVGGAVRTGAHRLLARGPHLAVGGRGRGEARGCIGRPRRKKRTRPSPDEQESF